jgi:release factor glutamine methyltransferase
LSDDPVARAAQRLAAAGINSAKLDARLLWNFATEIEASALVARGTGRAPALFDSFVERRLAREPLAYILGHKEFWSLDFAVGPGVLIPRPDSETLIEAVCRNVPDKSAALAVLDLGTGSGCLLISALAEYPNARGVGVDNSEQALDWARQNVAKHEVGGRTVLIASGWLEEASPGFDVILCNPPYISSRDIGVLEPEVRQFEPREALDGGLDGLDAYRALATRIGALLAPHGRAFVEIGAGQETQVRHIFEGKKLEVAGVRLDLAGIPRCIVLAAGPE